MISFAVEELQYPSIPHEDSAEIPGPNELWAETLGDPRICVAVLDGPIDRSHPSLTAANLSRVETLVSGIADQGPASQHGTHIASVIFGQHDGPIKGIAPHCRGLIVIKKYFYRT